jgi:large subunit ribosomal protein L21
MIKSLAGWQIIPNFPEVPAYDRRIARNNTYHRITRTFWRSEAWRKLMKYAIVEDGGKQYRAVIGESIEVDRYPLEVGEEIDMEKVLLISDGENVKVGTPFVKGAKIQATVLAQVKGPKVIVFRYKAKERIRTKTGHRQQYTRVRIDAITEE